MSLCFLRMRRTRLLVLAAVSALVSLLPIAAMAHPLGNFTVNRYSRIELAANQAGVVYIVDMAEIPTFQDRQTMDTNSDGTLSAGRDRHGARGAGGPGRRSDLRCESMASLSFCSQRNRR